MLFAITGTPGTGKSSVCRLLQNRYRIIDLNAVIRAKGFYTGMDRVRGCLIADLARLQEYLDREPGPLVIEGHLSHLLQPDIAIVLRTSPAVLTARLTQKGFHTRKIRENVEAEMLDVILIEAVELCPVVYELDTTDRTVTETAHTIREIIDAEIRMDEPLRSTLRRRFQPGHINWLGLTSP